MNGDGCGTFTKFLQGQVLGGLWIVLLWQFVLFLPNISAPHVQIQLWHNITRSSSTDHEFGHGIIHNLVLDVLSPLSPILIR